jgi:hypothetical protein
MTATAFSASMVKDPDLFYSVFKNPDTVIDFLKLKDGTSFDKIPESYTPKTNYLDNPDNLIVYTGESDGKGGFSMLAVRSQAFSNNWSFKGVHPSKPKIFREQVVWFDQGITVGSFEIIISATTAQSQPFAIYTEKGFIGIIPDSPEETRFILEGIHIVYSFETGFAVPDFVPKRPRDRNFLKKLNLCLI